MQPDRIGLQPLPHLVAPIAQLLGAVLLVRVRVGAWARARVRVRIGVLVLVRARAGLRTKVSDGARVRVSLARKFSCSLQNLSASLACSGRG